MRKKQIEEAAKKTVEHLNIFKAEFLKILPKEDKDLAHKFQSFVNRKIRKVAGKNLVRLPKHIKDTFCKKCFSDLRRGEEPVTKSGTKYVPLFCDRCQKIQRKDFLGQAKTKQSAETKITK